MKRVAHLWKNAKRFACGVKYGTFVHHRSAATGDRTIRPCKKCFPRAAKKAK